MPGVWNTASYDRRNLEVREKNSVQICFLAKSKYDSGVGMTENTVDKGKLREEQEERQLY